MIGCPLISVVVPVYNVANYLQRCDASIRQQTYPNLEVIYVDDGSTDGSASICDRLAERSGVRAVHKKNGGLGYARNTGMESAVGEYVVFLDSDDYYDSDLISALAAPVFDGRAEFTLAGFTRESGRQSSSRTLPDVGIPVVSNEAVMRGIFTRMLGFYPGKDDYIEMSACARLYDLEIIRREGLWFNSERDVLSEDLDFNLRYLQHVRSAMCIGNVGYHYCDNDGSLTNLYRVDRLEKQESLHERFSGVIDKLGLEEEAHVRLDNTLASIARYCVKLEYMRWQEGCCTRFELLKSISRICEDGYLRAALERLSSYPVPIQNRAVNSLILRRRTRELVFVMALKVRLGI